jgi:hypothetical protein
MTVALIIISAITLSIVLATPFILLTVPVGTLVRVVRESDKGSIGGREVANAQVLAALLENESQV